MCVDDCHENFTLLDCQEDFDIYLKRYFSENKSYTSSTFLFLCDITFLIYNIMLTTTTELFSLFTLNHYADGI